MEGEEEGKGSRGGVGIGTKPSILLKSVLVKLVLDKIDEERKLLYYFIEQCNSYNNILAAGAVDLSQEWKYLVDFCITHFFRKDLNSNSKIFIDNEITQVPRICRIWNLFPIIIKYGKHYINFVKPILFFIVSLHSYLTLSPHIRYTKLNLLYIFMHFFKGKLTQTILSSESDLKLYVKVIFIRLR